MRCALAVLLVVVTTASVRADDSQRADDSHRANDAARAGDAVPAQIRELYARGDYAGARELLLKQYANDPQPALLFALGQVELNLGHYEAAIDYYEKFIATGPAEEQVALAQQAIGAARIQMTAGPNREPPPTAVRRTPPRRWYTNDTGFVALGGAAVVLGGGVLAYSQHLGNDTSGSLSQFADRLEQARSARWTGIGIASAGALLIGVTFVRWRLRPDSEVIVSPTGASVVARW